MENPKQPATAAATATATTVEATTIPKTTRFKGLKTTRKKRIDQASAIVMDGDRELIMESVGKLSTWGESSSVVTMNVFSTTLSLLLKAHFA